MDKSKTIVVAGIPRSGSTWIFNAIRLIFELRSLVVEGQWIDDADFDMECDVHLIKAHQINTEILEIADLIISSRRDLRDIATSLIERGWTDESKALEMMSTIQAMHDFWSPRSVIDVAYDDLVSTPEAVIREMGQAVGEHLSEVQIGGILAKIPRQAVTTGPRGHDPVSLLHQNHIRDGRPGRWKEILPKELAEQICEQHGEWLRRYGYLDDDPPKLSED